MKTQHTPGPWVALPEEVDKDYIRIRGTRLGLRYKIANVITPTFAGVLESEAEETRRNARLIAAAPELLEALETIFPLIECVCDAGPFGEGWQSDELAAAIAKSRATIAKAKGETL